jgi:hypothetical protein
MSIARAKPVALALPVSSPVKSLARVQATYSRCRSVSYTSCKSALSPTCSIRSCNGTTSASPEHPAPPRADAKPGGWRSRYAGGVMRVAVTLCARD